ncbi:MAG: ABC transporter ATP-binding protein [Candidatus Rokubacteria bacterium]|nr:ABC transporter ATP-binding protein [Candidatus Rokubacteria bacterium]
MREPLVAVAGLGFAYRKRAGGARTPFAIRDLSFTVDPGEIVGVIGPNASGKTTLIRLLSRVLVPDCGEIHLGGEPLARLSRAAAARRVAVVPQELPSGLAYTVEEMVLMGRFPHGPSRVFESAGDRRAARDAMEAASVSTLAGRRLGELSGGERQRALLARALAQGAPLLILDEPTAHLDLRYQVECVGLLRRWNRETGLTVILVAHDLNLAAEVSDRLLLLDGGVLVRAGTPETVIDETVLERVYGCRVLVDKHPLSRRPTVQLVWPDAGGR